MEIIKKLKQQKLISPPDFLIPNTQYLCMMGSHAYGVHTKDSDFDLYGFTIPPKVYLLPHLAGHIVGFGTTPPKFDQFQTKKSVLFNKKEYDIVIYNIVKYFQKCYENNPNMLDSLFVPLSCRLHTPKIGQMVIDKRHLFLSKRIWPRFRGYALSQLHKLKNKNPVGERRLIVDQFGYDVKFAYHLFRLLGEAEQLLLTGTMDIQRDREVLKAVRRGDFSELKVLSYVDEKMADLEIIYTNSSLPDHPPEKELRELLLNCLEEHYGDLSIPHSDSLYQDAISQIKEIVDKL